MSWRSYACAQPCRGTDRGRGGLADTLYTAFLSTRKPLFDVLIWGLGPAVRFPTTTSNELGNGQWGIGPSIVLLSLIGPVTLGLLGNHVRLFSTGAKSATLIQPFTAYTFKTATSVNLQAEALFLEGPMVWSVPLSVLVSQVVPIGRIPVSFGPGARYFPVTFPQGPTWGLRVMITAIVPRRRR